MIIKSSSGMSVEFLNNASIRSIEAGQIRVSLKAANAYQKPGINIYLRKRNQPLKFFGLLGPGKGKKFQINGNAFFLNGSWEGLEYLLTVRLSKNNWQFRVDLTNNTAEAAELDFIYVQDVGLKEVNAGLINEYYVSQYLERRILWDENFGAVVCCRQNTREVTGHPWLMLACKNGAVDGTTDGMMFYGKTYRATGIPEALLHDNLPGEYAGESSVVALREKFFMLNSGQRHTSFFLAHYQSDHPEATSEEDLKLIPELFSDFEEFNGFPNEQDWKLPVTNIFNDSPFLPAEDLTNAEITEFFGTGFRNQEIKNNWLLSFFCGNYNHVVLKAKELMVDRPHGHIMQAQAGYTPDESIISTTAYMSGVFNSHLTQGNTNFNSLLSIFTSQFNLSPESGQRIFVRSNGKTFLLAVPSAFEMGLNHCRWIYKFENQIFQVRTWTSKQAPQVNMDFKVLKGQAVGLTIAHHFDQTNCWNVSAGEKPGEFIAVADNGSPIVKKFDNPQFRIILQTENINCKFNVKKKEFFETKSHCEDFIFKLETEETIEFCMSFLGEVVTKTKPIKFINPDQQWISDVKEAEEAWKQMSLQLSIESDDKHIRAIREILPWYGMNALTHFLTPYGLEQFGGAAWGTRDVSQGPIELLLSLEKYDEARKVLCTIFENQHSDGSWPQWWMFDSYREIRAHDAHGDVVYWCIIALSNYIRVTGDLSILDEHLAYFDSPDKTSINEHLDRVINMITKSFIPGTALVPFGGGDWNDSLQPVNKELAQRLISSWTVEMNYQAFICFMEVCRQSGNTQMAEKMADLAERIKKDFNTHLIKEGIVAGYGFVEKDGTISVLLHPSDRLTGISYSLLPMERGILSGIFTNDQAVFHRELIEKKLKGPDGARLMDRPLKYKGGIQKMFQRAESSTFFGREIGLMYVHEHIRYAELLALTGKAEQFIKALRQAIPVGYHEIVPKGDLRQANCYYSSSDVAFKSRYEADERYKELIKGKFVLRGGWRVYSSGPGIFINLIITRLLGLRVESGHVILDPVLTRSMDKLSFKMKLLNYPVEFIFHVIINSFGPQLILINGEKVIFRIEKNIYRCGGAIIPKSDFLALMNTKHNKIDIFL